MFLNYLYYLLHLLLVGEGLFPLRLRPGDWASDFLLQSAKSHYPQDSNNLGQKGGKTITP